MKQTAVEGDGSFAGHEVDGRWKATEASLTRDAAPHVEMAVAIEIRNRYLGGVETVEASAGGTRGHSTAAVV